MKKKRKKSFSDDEVAIYWDTHDATESHSLGPEKRLEMVYTPPVRSISLRLPVPLLTQIKQISAQMDIAYQALIKVWLTEKAKEISRQKAG